MAEPAPDESLSVERFIELAQNAVENREYDEALEYFDRALERRNNDPEIWIQKGDLLQRMGQSQPALNAYEQALNLNPRHYEALLGKGRVLEGTNDLASSRKVFERATRIKAQEYRGWYHLGVILAKQSQWRPALHAYDQSIRLNRDHYESWLQKAKMHETVDEYRAALEAYEHSLTLAKKYAPMMAMARLLVKLSRYDEAFERLGDAKRLATHRAEPYYYESLVASILDQPDRTLAAAEAGLERCGSGEQSLRSKLWFQLALYYERQGLQLQAYHCCTQSLNADPNYSRASTYRQILDTEYVADPSSQFLIAMLNQLLEPSSTKLPSTLRALAASGKTAVLAPAINACYHPEAVLKAACYEPRYDTNNKPISGTRMETELRQAFGLQLEEMATKVKAFTFDPRTINDRLTALIDRLKKPAKDLGGEELVQLLAEIEDQIPAQSFEMKKLMAQLLELLKANPGADFFELYMYLFVKTNSQLAQLLGYDSQPHALDIVNEPGYVRRQIFSRFRISNHTFETNVKRGLDDALSDLVARAVEDIKKTAAPQSLGHTKPTGHWLFPAGGDL